MDSVRVSGPARQLLSVAAEGPKNGIMFRFGLFCRGKADTPLIAEVRRLGFETHVLPSRWPSDPASLARLMRVAREQDVDVLQTHGYKSNVLAWIGRRHINRPWIAFLHGVTTENLRVHLYYRLERIAIRHADRIVVVSEAMRRECIRNGVKPERLRVVHNALITEDNILPRCKTSTEMIVGVIARLSPEKGVDIALRAFAQVVRTHPEVHMLIAGEGPERARLERLAGQLGLSGRVAWEGYVEDVARVYARLALVVIPSRSEGLPNVALEAMGAGVPIIAANVGGLGEIIADNRTGLLVPPEDPEALAIAIERLVYCGAERRQFSRAAREEASKRFSLSERVVQLRAVYEEIAVG